MFKKPFRVPVANTHPHILIAVQRWHNRRVVAVGKNPAFKDDVARSIQIMEDIEVLLDK